MSATGSTPLRATPPAARCSRTSPPPPTPVCCGPGPVSRSPAAAARTTARRPRLRGAHACAPRPGASTTSSLPGWAAASTSTPTSAWRPPPVSPAPTPMSPSAQPPCASTDAASEPVSARRGSALLLCGPHLPHCRTDRPRLFQNGADGVGHVVRPQVLVELRRAFGTAGADRELRGRARRADQGDPGALGAQLPVQRPGEAHLRVLGARVHRFIGATAETGDRADDDQVAAVALGAELLDRRPDAP